MTITAHAADRIPAVSHAEAMRITAAENARLLAQLRGLAGEQWQAPTDCTGWTVRDVAVHLVASAQAQASPVEFVRQVVAGRRLTAQIGRGPVPRRRGGHAGDGRRRRVRPHPLRPDRGPRDPAAQAAAVARPGAQSAAPSRPYWTASARASQDASMTLACTPTVVHSRCPSPVSTSTRVTASVPGRPSRMRTL